MRSLLLALPLLACSGCGIFGLNSEQRATLAQHQHNAGLYWGANRLPQALDQVRQGLEIDPEDYRLNSIKGYCLMRQAKDPRFATTRARRRGLLDDARAAFDATFALRGLHEHMPYVLLGDALLHEELARFAAEEKRDAADEAKRREIEGTERALLEVRLQELDLEMQQDLARADRDLQELLRRGDMLLLAHKHKLNIESLRGNYVGAVEAGQRYLELASKEHSAKQKVFESTMQVGQEERAAREISDLMADELTVRSQLANLHYDHGKFDMAVTELDTILRLDPSRSADYYNRARALYESKRYDEAYRDVQKFLATHSLPPGHATLLRAHEMLRRIEERR